MTEIAIESPFTAAGFGGAYRSTRSRRPGEVNLKSCGLLHPSAAEFHAATLRRIDPIEILTYPVLAETYALVARQLGVDADLLVLTPGSDPGLGLLLRAFPRAERIVLHTPNFGGWSKFARIAGRTLDQVLPAESGEFRLADLTERMRQGAPAFVVVTQPHSYTGQVHAAAELEELAEEVGRHGSLLVLDTAYLAFTEGGEELVRGVVGRPHVVRVNSFSKSHGLSGARIAALALHPERAGHVFDLDPEAPVSGVALALLRAALAEPELFATIQADVRRLRGVFATLIEDSMPGWRARPSGGNFVAFDVPEPATAAGAYEYLNEHAIITRDLSGLPGMPAAVRIAIGDEPTVHRVADLLTTWRRGRSL
ncbi:aminotransferase class I/II-fold pyridoxal phosphate-dependent enzyme [Nocardia sp. NPDC088792]|uniref:aminotransferase class I/II-fold pyridoxal phosphate-dependent enzyme n=1 Tax=Nocardia sp. NPDC088792 TaxID=3364332 RepID=UPI003804F249